MYLKVFGIVICASVSQDSPVAKLRCPNAALKINAANNINPPKIVCSEITSLKNNQTHNGPRSTSARDNKANCVAGKDFYPIVYRTNPAPT